VGETQELRYKGSFKRRRALVTEIIGSGLVIDFYLR